jgi:yersiniabactin nonribosomal peptide synthetase
VLSEMSVPFPLEDISTFFFQKNYTDQRQKTGNMLLTKTEWIELIQNVGMELAAVYPENTFKKDYPQYVYLLRSHKKNQQTVIKDIEKFIKEKVPAYMVPQNFYCISSLPMTGNGKVDRKRLISIVTNDKSDKTYVEPMTETEKRLCEIWEKLLNVKVQKNSNYFRLGGDSLLVTQLSAEIEKIFNIDFSIETVFNKQTLLDMADYIDKTRKNDEKLKYKFVVDEENRFEPFPLTDVQQAYWFGRNDVFQFGGMSAQCYFEMDCENIDLGKAEEVFNRLIQKHGILRGVILKDGQTQRILETVPWLKIKRHDFTNIDDQEQKNKLLGIRNEMSHKKYDFYQWPLFDIQSAKLSDEISRVFISLDNILIDGWSMFYILKEWNYLYHHPDEDVLTCGISFRDYVLNYEMMKATGLYDRDWDYWKQKVSQIYPSPDLPINAGVYDKSTIFYRFSKRISESCWETLKSKIKDYSITPAAFLLSVYAEIIFRWSRSEKFSINLTHFNRIPFHKDIEKLVGDFTALTIYSIDMDSAKSFLERTKIIQQKLWEDLNHPYVSGVEIERYLNKSGSIYLWTWFGAGIRA